MIIEILNLIGKIQTRSPTILFIPGVMTSPKVFEGINIPDGFQWAWVDWGMSEGPWDICTLGKRLVNTIEQKKLGKVILAGYSAGGVIALSAALEKNNLISGLLLSNTGPCTIGHGDPSFPQNIINNWGQSKFLEDFFNSCFSKKIPSALKQELLNYVQLINVQAAYQSSLSLRKIDLRNELHNIKCPVVIAHGIHDSRRTKNNVKDLTNGIPGAEVFWLDGGHTIMVEDIQNYEKALYHLTEMITKF